MFQTKVLEKIKTYFVLLFSVENLAVYKIMWGNYVIACQATVENTAHAYCMSGN